MDFFGEGADVQATQIDTEHIELRAVPSTLHPSRSLLDVLLGLDFAWREQPSGRILESACAMATEYKKASAQARKHSDDARESWHHHCRELAEIRGFAADAAENLEVTKSKSRRRKRQD
jgi:hypothetical protein